MNSIAKTNGRNSVLDIAKGIGAILVVYGHCVESIGGGYIYIYSFHMPLFFIIAGYLFKAEKYSSVKSFLCSRWRTLLKPYIIASLISVLVWSTFNIIVVGVPINKIFVFDIIKALLQIPYARGSAYIPYNLPLWFIPCLFAAEMLYWLLTKIDNLYIRLGIVFMFVLFGWWTASQYAIFDFSYLPWNLSGAFFTLVFFAIGNSVRKCNIDKMLGFLSKKVDIVLCILLFIGLFPLSNLLGKVSVGQRNFGNGLLFYCTGCVGTLAIVLLSSLIKECRLLEFFGRNSFYMMCVQIPVFYYGVNTVLSLLGKYFLPQAHQLDPHILQEGLMAFILVLPISAIIVWFIERIINKRKSHRAYAKSN